MIDQTYRANYSNHKQHQNQNKKEIFTHGWHNCNVKIENKNEAGINYQNNYVRRKYECVKTIQSKFPILFGE